MVHGVFIPPKPCRFRRRGGLKSLMLSTTLMKDKYILHIIIEIVNMIDLLKDLVYIYKLDIIVYHVFNTFIVEIPFLSTIKHIALKFSNVQIF
jgi:hypothetical protein